MQAAALLALGTVPIVDDLSERRVVISLQKVDFDRVHPALVAQSVLETVPIEAHGRLALLDAREEELDLLEFCRRSKGPTANCGKHLWYAVVVSDGHLGVGVKRGGEGSRAQHRNKRLTLLHKRD